MAVIKTAISIDKDVFAQVDEAAREMRVSRSRVFALALEDFLKRRRNRLIEEQMDRALAEIFETTEDQKAQAAMKVKQRRIAERESW
jgi:metal-responsive CopG/Arc/MetJ family transcriptional regulator